MRIPGLLSLNRLLAIRYMPFLLVAATINIVVFFIIQMMVTGEYSKVSVTPIVRIDDFIRLRRDMTPPEVIEETAELEEPEIEQDLPAPNMPMPQIAPPAPTSQASVPVPEFDVSLNTNAISSLRSLLNTSRRKPAAPRIATNLVPTLRIPPVYPQQALNMGIEGIVTVEFTIAPDGSVTDPVIVRARPEKVFDQSVLQAISKWKYPPKIENGRAVEIRARQDISFTLDDY